MSLNQTPSSERIHIGIFGKRNAGKSSIINAITGQNTALVSEIKGTTTDPVYKSMELLPLGPVVLMDTPGLDDEGYLGELRVQRSLEVLGKTDIALLVIDGTRGMGEWDGELAKKLKGQGIPCLIVWNKSDLESKPAPTAEFPVISVSAATGEGIQELKECLAGLIPEKKQEKHLIADLLQPLDLVVLVVPIDKSAPKGRLILPQQQTIRDILETGATSVVVRDTELGETLRVLGRKPKLVITDSQVFPQVAAKVPKDIWLTSFSILFARYKGNLRQAVEGVRVLEELEDSDKVLISEGCTHHRQCEDIGTVKLPAWIREYTGKNPEFVFTSGGDFLKELGDYKLVIHCGGCMLSEREMQNRLSQAERAKIPMTNYGTLIAYIKGILERSLEPFRGKRKKASLKEQLFAYASSDYYGFHMPGHKRRMGKLGEPYQIDITEIDGFDDLHHPKEGGVLVKAQERAARLYGAKETHFLVNGSTAGILSAISTCCHFGGQILMARNSHRSAYHGAELRNLKPWYLYPQFLNSLWINGGILSSEVENSLQEHPEIETVFITSPTYEGICTDVKSIARICHSYGVPLIVDQAHGAHFPFSDYFPEDALSAGADVVIQSVHKTLPALTQTALLHVQGGLVDRERLHQYLSIYQSSSPSYVLMASIDSCMEWLEESGEEDFKAYVRRLEHFRENCKDLEGLKLLGKELLGKAAVHDFDNSRLVIFAGHAGVTGGEISNWLRDRYHLEMEMTAKHYVTGISSVADDEEAFIHLSRALHKLDMEIRKKEGHGTVPMVMGQQLFGTPSILPLGTVLEQEKEWVELRQAENRIAGTYLYLYPPGIPLVVPGESFTKNLCDQIKACLEAGQELHGLAKDGRINVIKGKNSR